MKLKCRIHEKDYDIVTGATFREEYNETLDSGAIIIDQIPKIKNLKPYDDVYIWNADENFNGYANVGEKVALQDLGTLEYSVSNRFYGSVFPNVVEDTYLADNIPYVWSSYFNIAGGYKYKLSGISNRLFPCLIDLWASNFLYGLDLNVSMPRWGIPKVTFKYKLMRRSDNQILYGYYDLPRYYREVGSYPAGIEEGFLVLTKNTSYASDAGAPEKLYVTFELNEPYLGGTSIYPVVTANIRLKVYTDAISTLSSPTSSQSFVIKELSKPANDYVYQYTYNFDGLYPTAPVPQVNFGITGLTKEQILDLENVKVDVNAQGYNIKAKCAKPEWDSENENIKLHFKLYGTGLIVNDDDGFDINLNEESIRSWQCTNAAIYVRYLGDVLDGTTLDQRIPIDKIINNPSDELFLTLSNIASTSNILPTFFKHLLVDSFSCEMLSLEKTVSKRLYKYKIDLMSETKRLEKVVLPNVSITQPIVGDKRSIWYYLNQFVNLYSPKIKFKDENNKWVYKNKFSIDARTFGDYFFSSVQSNSARQYEKYINIPVHEIFQDDIFAPEMSLTAPTLRELLSRLMIVKDCIPIVNNDVIYAMKISDTHGAFSIKDENFSFISENMSSGNYSTSFRREYGGAISQKNSAHLTEFLGFRTSGTSDGLMLLSNMYLQTRFPIYKINKLYMCYYKKIPVTTISTNTTYNKLVLVKQDITKLVLQDTVRNTLSGDWTHLKGSGTLPHWQNMDIDEMATYKVLTLGYSIGSNIISGWGESYTYITDFLGWTNATKTYLENIMIILDQNHPFGVGDHQFLTTDERFAGGSTSWLSAMITPNNSANVTTKLKSIFFQMDYIAMYQGAIIHSKENIDDDELVSPDNCSSALSILEVDGLFEREKANRFANTEYSFIARFDSVLQMDDNTHNNIIGAIFSPSEGETAIIYHREYQIYDDCVLANFAGTHDYVLKNYFTTVFAKYRTYSYAGYNESVIRAENDRYLCFLSDDRCYYEEDVGGDASKQEVVANILSAFSENDIGDDLNVVYKDKINGGYFAFKEGNQIKYYFSDVNQFVSGYSLCFNIRMFDNITNGNYISAMDYQYGPKEDGLAIGSQLTWYKMPISNTDGFLQSMGCYFGHFEENDYYYNYLHWNDDNNANALYSKILNLPLVPINPTFSFGREYDFCKDNKEIIDYTLQYEMINQDDNLIFSEWLMKLTDFSDYIKFSTPRIINNKAELGDGFTAKFWSEKGDWNPTLIFSGGFEYSQRIRLIFSKSSVDLNNIIQVGTNLSGVKTTGVLVSETTGVPTGDSGIGNSNNWRTEIKIELGEITEVGTTPVFNQRYFKLRVSLHRHWKYWKYVHGVYTGEQTSDGDYETELLFGLWAEDNDFYTYNYSGYILPQDGPDTDVGRYSLQYAGHTEESNADVVGGAVQLDVNPYPYPKTMYILVSNKDIEESLVYAQFKPNELPDGFANVNLLEPGDTSSSGPTFKDIFDIEVDENGRQYIKYTANGWLYHTMNNYRSVQYWYYDAEGDGYMHFVFGINTRDEDNENIFGKKIYISTLKNRNPVVYDYLHRECGTVMNFADEENATSYGQQLFTPNEDDEED